MRRALLIFSLLGLPFQVALSAGVSLELVHSYPFGHQVDQFVRIFARNLEELSNGSVVVIVRSGYSGFSRQYPDMLSEGMIDLAVVSRHDLQMIPELRVFSLPFLIRDRRKLREVLQGSVRELLNTAFRHQDLQLLAVLDGSFRLIGLREQDDDELFNLKGMKMRTLDRDSSEVFSQAGVLTVRLPFSELYSEMQIGAIDAYETSLSAVGQGGLSEVSAKIILTNHLYDPMFLIASNHQLEELDTENIRILQNAASELEKLTFQAGEENEHHVLDKLRNMGVEVRKPKATANDMQWLIETTRYVYDLYVTEVENGAELVKPFLDYHF